MRKEFSNEDLKPGMFVELKNGAKGVLIPCYYVTSNSVELCVIRGDRENSRICEARIYDGIRNNNNFDIIKVFDLNKGNDASLFSSINRDLLWEYEEPKREITIEEIETLLGYPIKIVKEK